MPQGDQARGRAALKGIVPPVLTPMTDDGRIDHESLASLVRWLVDRGVHGIWVMGTTGEFTAFDVEERAAAVATAVQAARGKVPVVANVGDASTRLAVQHARRAAEAGADAIALLPPYYYPNSQEELLRHYRTVRSAVDLPLLIYNFPQMVKVRLEVSAVLALAEEGTVIGVKDSQNDLEWFRQVVLGTRERGLDFRGFLGTRGLVDAGLQIGAVGAIPGGSNIAPSACVAIYDAVQRKDYAAAAAAQERFLQAERVAQVARMDGRSASLAAMKAVLVHLGVIRTPRAMEPILPLTPGEMAEIGRLVPQLPLG